MSIKYSEISAFLAEAKKKKPLTTGDCDAPGVDDSVAKITEETDMRYCPKCEKMEVREECAYGPDYWDSFAIKNFSETVLGEIAPALAIPLVAAGGYAAYKGLKHLKKKGDEALDNARQNATLNGKPFGAGARQRAIERGAGAKPGTLDPKMQRLRREEVELKYDKSKKSEGNMPTVKAPGKAVPMPTVRGSKAVPMPRASVKTEETELQENNPRVTGRPNNPSILQRIDAMLPGRAMTYQGFKDKTRKPYQYKSPETGPNYTGNRTDVNNYRAGGGNAAVKDGKTADQVRAQGAKNLKARPNIPNVHNWTDNGVKTYAGSPPMRFNVRKEEVTIEEGSAAWQKSAGKNKEGGLNEKGRKSYERENPGSDLKAPQPEGGSRKKSFCARMGGMKKKLTSSKTANDPDSRINKSLRKWKC